MSNNQPNIACEVVGEPDDSMTQIRLNILQPLSEQIINAMSSVLGSGHQEKFTTPPLSPKAPREVIKTKLIHCQRCGSNVGMLIFAGDAKEEADFENYARKMYPQYMDFNTST